MADQNRKQQNQDEPIEQPISPRPVDPQETQETERERSNREPASTADDRGLLDELDGESDVDDLGDDSIIEDEDLSSR